MPNAINIPQAIPTSMEVALHELGESFAISLATVQNELACYPNELGSFLLDEIEVTIPVRLRVDELGQIRVHTVDDTPDKPESGQIRLCIRPVLGASQTIPQCANQPLSALGDVLPTEAIKQLEKLRVFSIEDLLRVARNPAGQRAVEELLPEVKLKDAIDRATLFTLPNLSPRLAATLVQMGITSPVNLVNHDSKTLADEINKRLEGKLEKMVTPEDILDFQASIRRLTQIRLLGSNERSREIASR